MSNLDEFLNSLKDNSNFKQDVKPFGVTIVEYTEVNLNETNDNSENKNKTLQKYFDTIDGSFLADNANDAAEKLNSKGDEYFDKRENESARESYHAAYKTCDNDYENRDNFRSNRQHAKSLLIHEEGRILYEDQNKYKAGKEKLHEAFKIFPQSKIDDRKKFANNFAFMLNSFGNEFYDKGSFYNSIENYKEAVEISSSDNEELSKYKDNLRIIEICLSHFQKGIDLHISKNYQAAIVEFRKALAVTPKSRSDARNFISCALSCSLNLHANEFVTQENYAEALKILQELMDVCPPDSESFKMYETNFNLVKVNILKKEASDHYNGGNFEAAVEKFRMALAIVPESQEKERNFCRNYVGAALNSLGAKKRAEENHEESLRFFKEAIAISTSNCTYLDGYRKNEAIAKSSIVYNQEAWLDNQDDDHEEEAITKCMQALEMIPQLEMTTRNKSANEIASLLNSLAAKLNSEGKVDEAVKKFEEAVAISTDDNEKLKDYKSNLNMAKSVKLFKDGDEYFATDNYEAAIEKYRQGIEMCTQLNFKKVYQEKTSYALYFLGNNYSKVKDYSTAIKYYQDAIDICPADSEHLSVITENLDFTNAVKLLKEGDQLYEQEGKREEGIEKYLEAVKIFPDSDVAFKNKFSNQVVKKINLYGMELRRENMKRR